MVKNSKSGFENLYSILGKFYSLGVLCLAAFMDIFFSLPEWRHRISLSSNEFKQTEFHTLLNSVFCRYGIVTEFCWIFYFAGIVDTLVGRNDFFPGL